jgi:hypothetical protein
MNYSQVPMEMSLGGIYFPPILLAIVLGTLVTWVITRFLNKFELVRFIWNPPLFFVALSIICTGLVGCFIIPI